MNAIQLSDFEPAMELTYDSVGRILCGPKIGDTLRQNQALILALHQGELKERPAVGVGIGDMLLDNDPIYWRNRIREQLEMDGQTVEKVVLTTTGITIEASY